VGFIGVMEAEGKPVEIGVRLKVVGGKIAEAEHIVAAVREANLVRLKTPRLPLVTSVTEPYRDARGRLLHIAASYYDALDNNNGSLAPFADDCVRYENGMQTVRNPVPATRRRVSAWPERSAAPSSWIRTRSSTSTPSTTAACGSPTKRTALRSGSRTSAIR
jgi:hypothetical protein